MTAAEKAAAEAAAAAAKKKKPMVSLDTDLPDIAAGAIAGAVIGWSGIAGGGEKKVMNGAIMGALVALTVPTFRGLVGNLMPAA
jgi:hypothetical protein